ncbi:hypothetical protein PtB15_16B219 [Puccinia triticina]|nr:hypothetical protein PtB15_16B219 [Puccinia triticina]
MSPLDYDLFRKMQALMGVTPDFFEVCLMVDADTTVQRDSVSHLTRITNKRQSWVTAIQVFEYYISHHLTKASESVFGGVTCLPGCFSMYRLKARRLNDGDWVPILAQPEICREYSQSVMMFCPQAKCRTLVPDEFAVLVSQRRCWINSTIHNLMELVRVPNLCGTFCFSMQFVVFMELIGTIILPIAITLTYSLVINSFLHPPKSFSDAIPLILLASILGLPAVLILATSREVSYVFWMLIYLIALPVWNFVLPLYAFWHFGDFSWGKTRKVQGEAKSQGHDSGSKTTFDANTIPHRRWEEWERSRLKKIKREERRRREFERTFGPQGFHLSTAGGGRDTESMVSSEDDRVDGTGHSTVHADEVGLILDQGCEDEPPSLSGLGEPKCPNPAIRPPSARGSPLGFVPEYTPLHHHHHAHHLNTLPTSASSFGTAPRDPDPRSRSASPITSSRDPQPPLRYRLEDS